MQLLGEVNFSFGNLSTLLEAHEVNRSNLSNLIRETEKERVCTCVSVNLFSSCGGFPTEHYPSALSNPWPDYKNIDSSGCVLQDCCIVLTGKPLLLLLAVAVQRKECGHLKSATKLQLTFNARIFQIGSVVPETICGVLKKESLVTKYSKYSKRIVFRTINQNLVIWSQSVTQMDTALTASKTVFHLFLQVRKSGPELPQINIMK